MNSDPKKYFAELSEEMGPVAAHIKRASEDYHGKDAADLQDERDGQLTIDVYQTPHAIVVESPIAGVNSDDIDISITSESVTIRGHRERMHMVSDDNYFYQECYWGRFSRSVILPEEIDADNAEATIKNGVLKITMPKFAKYHSKKLKVEEK